MNRRTLLAALVAAPAAAIGAAPAKRALPTTVTQNIDARGASADLIARLPEILRKQNERLEAKIIADIRRGRLT